MIGWDIFHPAWRAAMFAYVIVILIYVNAMRRSDRDDEQTRRDAHQKRRARQKKRRALNDLLERGGPRS